MSNGNGNLKDMTAEQRKKLIERTEERRRDSERRPMDMDRDFSWENTDFKGQDND